MKSLLIRTAAATALAATFATAATAQDGGSGFVFAQYSNTDVDFGPADSDYGGWGLGGAFAFDASDLWDVQFDASYNSYDASPDVDVFDGQAHLMNRDEVRAWGGFVSFADTDADTLFGLGGEYQAYGAGSTFGVQLSYLSGDDVVDNIYGGCGFARGYANENFAFEGRVGLAQADYGGTDTSAYSIGAGAAYRFMDTPFEIQGGVDYADLDDFDVSATTLSIRGVYNFGTGSVQERDQEGASFRGASCLNAIARF